MILTDHLSKQLNHINGDMDKSQGPTEGTVSCCVLLGVSFRAEVQC